MSRAAKNNLHIDPLPGGGWLLQGYFRGEQVRRRNSDIAKLEMLKLGMEAQLAAKAKSEAEQPKLRLTRLTESQLRDAEAATEMAKGRRLIECVAAADRVLPPVAGVSCVAAKEEWIVALKKRKRSWRTEQKNVLRVDDFLGFSKVKHLEDIRPEMCEAWIYRGDLADYTRITDAEVLRAWLNFCMRRRMLLVSPFEIDMVDLKASARPVEDARILVPDHCFALLMAAAAVDAEEKPDERYHELTAYVILATWCFMSPQEVFRTSRKKMKLDQPTPVIEVDTVKRRTAKYRLVTVPTNVLPLLRAAVANWPDTREVKERNGKRKLRIPFAVKLSRSKWDRVRANAGLLEREQRQKRGGNRKHKNSEWQDSILRHTGISYFYQSLTVKAQRGEFNEKSIIAEVCRQAGNTNDTAFRHYLTLPKEGDSDRFGAKPTLTLLSAAAAA